MEVLIEILVQLFFEIFVQILVALFTHFAQFININTSAKRILKYSISSLIFGLTLTLLGFSISYKRDLYIHSILIYFFVLVLIYVVRFMIQNNDHTKLLKTITWLTRIIHLIFPVIMIITATIYYNNESNYIILASCMALFIYICIYIYKIWNFYNKKQHNKQTKKRLSN